MAIDWEQYAVAETPDWEQYATPQNPQDEELGTMEKFYRASGIHGANRAFANIFGFGEHVKRANEAAKRAEQTHPVATALGGGAANVYSSIPFFMAGAGAARGLPLVKNLSQAGKLGKYAQNIIGSGIGGGILGGVRKPEGDETRSGNIQKDALVASLIEAALPGVGLAFKPIKSAYNTIAKHGFGAESKVAKDVLRGLTSAEGQEASNVYQAGQRIGIELTPAEASGSPILAQVEGKLGTSEPGQEAYMQFKKGQKEAQEKAVKELLEHISPNKKVASKDVRKAAKTVIEQDTEAMIAKAQPYYEAAERETLKPNTLNSILADSNVSQAWEQVLKDPLYATEIEGYPKNSVKVLDLVKRNLDAKIAQASNFGNSDAVRILTEAKHKLVSKLDNVSPNYKKARSIYAADAAPLQELLQSNVGKLANISDRNLKNVSKIIFDPSQTDVEVLANIRDNVTKQDPEAWRRIIRNEMERRLDSKTASKTRNSGSNFYEQIVGTDRNFEQFHEALAGDKIAQQKLADMRASFRNLINSYTVKTAAGQAKSSLDVPRSGPQFWQKLATNLVGGQYDQAAVEIITNPKWESTYLPKITSKSSNQDKVKFLEALQKVAKQSTKVGAMNAAQNDGEE